MTRDVERSPAVLEADDCPAMTEQESRLEALFEAAQDIEAGRTWTVEEFKPRLEILKARAQCIADRR